MERQEADYDDRRYAVHGRVTGALGEPLEHAEVIVWWQRIRDRRLLGEGRTSEDGTYHVRYRIPENAPGPVLIVVEAVSRHLEEPLVSAATVAQEDLTVDLAVVPHDRSEWMRGATSTC